MNNDVTDLQLRDRFGDDVPDVVASSVFAYGQVAANGVRTAHNSPQAPRVTPGRVAHREEREEALHATLNAAATRGEGAGNRPVEEEPDEFRTCFEKDLDRIRYSPAFRRLGHKCQVFVAPEDDHLRNRLTHALEVAQVAVAIARPLGLNVALVEAAAIGHDCGHGPGGHASEEAFSGFLDGGYDHATYGADVVLGSLNLCVETSDAIRNHSWRRPQPATPEGVVVSWADRIAYVCHDFDDAVRAGIVTRDDLPEVVAHTLGHTQSVQIGALVAAMIHTTNTTGVLGMASPYIDALDEFRRFNYDRIYMRDASRNQALKVISLLSSLVEYYIASPGHIPDIAAGASARPEPATVDAAHAAVRYVSSMTDRYAIRQGVELLGFDVPALPQA